MGSNDHILFGLRILSGISGIVLMYFLWIRRHSEGASYLLLFEFFATIWVVADAFEGISSTLSEKLKWAQIAYIGITMTPVFYLMFTIAFAQHKRLINLAFFYALLIVPGITVLLVFTNGYHGLIWKKISLSAETGRAVFSYGPWFWLFVSFAYVYLVIGVLHLLYGTFKFYTFYRTQILLLITGSLLPFVSNILYVFKLMPVTGVDLTPIVFILSGLCIGLSVFWFRLFDIVPLARKQVIDNLNDGILVVDLSQRVIDANPAFNKISGLSNDQLIGCLADHVFHILTRDERLPDEKEFKFEIQLERNMKPQYYEVRGFPVFYKNHKIIGETIVLHDITSLKDSLNSLAEYNKNLCIENEEKERLIADLDAYARTVAHDLKNPMSVIVGYTELIQENIHKLSRDALKERIDLINKEGYRICSIIEELLLFSRIRLEDVNLIPVNMQIIINKSLERLFTFIDKDRLQINMPESWPVVLGHPQWMEEVWINLLSNACKYGGNPPALILGYEKSNGTHYRFYVKDNGNGLPPESLKKLFTEFERLSARHVDGHGLGLFIVKRIVEKLGGETTVSSDNAPGKGCEFSFTLKGIL
jgi:PAS domain S-box-containing protein